MALRIKRLTTVGNAATAQTVTAFSTINKDIDRSCDFKTLNTGNGVVITDDAAGNLTIAADPAGLAVPVIKRSSAAVTSNASATYVNVTGLSFTVVPGTYRFRAVLPSTVASGTGGIKYGFNYTTAVLTSIEATGIGYTASAVAVQHTTTITAQTDLFTQAAVVIMTVLEGTMVVATGGTVDVQTAQNTSNGSNTVTLVGASAEFIRIA